jgi:RNA polymerase sigma-70 factor (ECF subfamily)
MSHDPVTLDSLLSHRGWALRVARRLVREEGEAEDLVQRTWMAALRHPPATERGTRPWIRKVILNLARERHRRKEARERHERASWGAEHAAPDTAEDVARAEICRLLGERLLELNEPYRTVVLQRFYEDLSSAEIAQRLGIPAGTVRWRLKVGLDQLRADLDRRSHGDRSRWVSSLLVLLPRASSTAERTREASAAPVSSASLLPTGGWLALGAAGILGLLLWMRGDPEARASAAPLVAELGPANAAAAARDEAPPRAALGARTPVPIPSDAPPDVPPEPPRGLALRVQDEEGRPVSGAQILVARASGFEPRETSDAEGRAWLAARPEDVGALGLTVTRGHVGIRALAPGRVASALVHAAPPFTSEHEVRLVVGGPDSVLTGRVVEADGRGVANAIVAWFTLARLEEEPEGDFSSPSYLSATSDAEGRFVLAHLPRAKGVLACFASGLPPSSMACDTREVGRPLELRVGRGAKVSGTIRWPGGTPAAGVRIDCEPIVKAEEWSTGLPGYRAASGGFGESTRSDANGRFRLAGITTGGPPRTLWALDEASGWTASIRLELEEGNDVVWDAELSQRAGFRLRLVDESGRALAGWVAHLRCPAPFDSEWWVRRSAADAEGRVQVTDCPDAEALLDVFPPSGAGASRAARRLKPGPEEHTILVETRSRSSIRGRVVDSAGAPELRGRLSIHSLQTTLATTLGRDEDGSFRANLLPGRYVLVMKLDQSAVQLGELRLRSAEELDLGTLATPPMGLLRLSAAALHDGGRQRPHYGLFRAADDEREGSFLRVGSGPLVDEVLLTVYAGRYRVYANDGAGKTSVHEVQVQPYAELRLDLAP